MRLDELLRFTGRFFEEKGVAYYVFGATAMNFWIPPRSTADLDAVLCIDKARARKLAGELRAATFRITSTLERLLLEGRLIKIPLGESELDLKLGTSPHEREALARAKVFAAEDFRLRVAVPESEWQRLDALAPVAGMPVEAFIETGERTALGYLAKPFTDQLARAFREE